MKENKERKLGAILSYVAIIANTLVQVLYTPFLVSRLGQSEYGLYSLVSSIIGYLTVLDFGFGNAIIVHTAKYRAMGETEKEKMLHGMFKMIYLVIGVIAGIGGVILALCSSSIFGGTMNGYELEQMRIMLFILSFNLFISFAFSIYSSIVTASERFVFQKSLTIFATIAKPLLMIPILFMGYKSVALCLVITLVNIVVLASNYWFCKRKLQVSTKFMGFDRKLFKIIFAYSFWIFLNQVVDKVNWSADQFILGAVSGTVAVSVYSAASTLNTLFINLSTAISGVMLPKMSKMVSKKASSEELTDEFIKVGRIQYYIIFLMASGLIIFGKQFIKHLGLSIMQAMNKYKFRSIMMTVMAAFNIVMSIFLARLFGATGAAIGTAVSLIICNIIIINIYYYRVIRLNVLKFWRQIGGMTIKFMIIPILMYVATTLFDINGWISLVLCILIYVAAFALFSFGFCFNNYERKIVNQFVRKLTKGKSDR